MTSDSTHFKWLTTTFILLTIAWIQTPAAKPWPNFQPNIGFRTNAGYRPFRPSNGFRPYNIITPLMIPNGGYNPGGQRCTCLGPSWSTRVIDVDEVPSSEETTDDEY